MTSSTGRKYKLIGELLIPDNSTLWVDYLPGGVSEGWNAVDLNSAATAVLRRGFFILDQVTAEDMLTWLAGLISTALENMGADTDTFTFSLDQVTGIVTSSYSDSPGDQMKLAFTDPTGGGSTDTSYEVRDWLRMDSTLALDEITILQNGSLVGYRTHAYALYPIKIELDDLPVNDVTGGQSVPDEGTPYSLKVSQRVGHMLTVWLSDSFPRGASYNEYHQMLDLMEHASKGWIFRHYPDKTITDPFAFVTAPNGYEEWVLDRNDWNWRPKPAFGNWYKQFKKSLNLHSANSS